ncbi:hypothetical protein [Clostridium tetanomorphum]|nr:hypothetical protein [Clostridium tetanomorphum]SQC02509.1 TPR domain-containing protein [Clostridium tetanomorphum]
MKATKGILLEKKITSLMCSVVSETWSSSIESRYKDFNDELIELNKRWSRNGFLKSREDAKNKIELEMSQLKNPPNDYKEAYNTLVELYGYYSQIYNQSVSPKGSLITYNQDVNNKTGEFDKIYDKLAIIKPDIKLIDMDEPDDSKDNLNQLNTNIVKNKFQSIDNNKNITSNEAVDIVKRFFPQLNSDAIIEYDHTENINGKDYYVVHIYSIVNNHTATVGWYCVDTNTGKAYEWNLANGTLAILS